MAMNKKYILPLILTVLVIVSGLLYWIKGSPEEAGMDVSDRRFKIDNIQDVGIIAIQRKNYPKVIFTKKGNKWFMNNGREARNEATGYLLHTMNKLTLKYIPNQLGSERIIRAINDNGIKVQIYDTDEKLMKSFFLGPDLGDGTGTAFLMEGAKQPYVLFTQGSQTSIRTHFEFEMNEYETKDIFVEKADDIKLVEIKYPYDRPSSFKLEKKLLGWELTNPYTGTRLPKFNEKLVDPYLSGFGNIIAEYNDSNNPNRTMILQKPVFCEVKVVHKDGSSRSVTFFSLANIEFNESKYSPKEIGPDNRFMVHTDKDEFFLIQHRVTQKILVAFDSFALR